MVEQKENPTFIHKFMKLNSSTTIKIERAKPLKSGTSQYGEWNLWLISVKDQPVEYRSTKQKLEKYSGEATFFPDKELHDIMMKATGGVKVGVELELKKVAVELKDGKLGTKIEAKVVKDGSTPSSTILYSHDKYLKDFKRFAEFKFVTETKESFVEFGQHEPYNIPADVLNNMWQNYLDQK